MDVETTCDMCDEPVKVLIHVQLFAGDDPLDMWICYADFDVMRDEAKEPALHANTE